MMRAWLLVGVVACGPSVTARDPQVAGRDALAKATDANAFVQLARGDVTNGGLWFDDEACRRDFGVPGVVPKDKLGAFAQCLAGLHMTPSQREDAFGDVVVMTYGAGFEIEARVTAEDAGPRLAWIGFESQRNDADRLPTVSSAAIEALRTAGDRDGPLDPAIGATLATPARAAFTWVKFCLDETGAVTEKHAHEATSLAARAAFLDAMSTWKFKPFVAGGRPIAVCSLARLAYPPGAAPSPEIVPLPPPSSHGEDALTIAEGPDDATASDPRFVEGKRISGTAAIVPDDGTKVAIQRSKRLELLGRFRLCIDATGHVESVVPLRSTGFAAYDRRLLQGMRAWVYSPYKIDGRPVAVCRGIKFMYRQGGS